MIDGPLVSVLVPAYNREATIERCVASALNGTHRNVEVIAADNGSTDGTLARLNALATGDSRLRVLAHPANRGPLPNWQSCLAEAKGSFVHWLWSDDWVEPKFYTALLEGMTRTGATMALSAARIVSESDGWHYHRYSLAGPRHDARALLKEGLTGFSLPLSPAAALLPADSVRRHFHATLPPASDLDCGRTAIGPDALVILGALLEAKTVYCHPDSLVNFSLGKTSITATTSKCHRARHYAWARLWWARRHGLPRLWSWADLGRLVYCGRPFVAVRGLVTG